MIPFQTWLSQIIGYGHFIADTLGVRRVWVDGDHSRTSVVDFDELYEQIFDDLDSDTFEKQLDAYLPVDPIKREVLKAFLQEIRGIDTLRSQDRRLYSAATLLGSKEWGQLVDVAHRIASSFPLIEDGEKEL